MELNLEQLQRHVQHNCHISDASHAGSYTLCIYLLKMREYYRWEHELDFETRIDNDDIGRWLTERETLWESLEDTPFRQLDLANKNYEPFDADGINSILLDKGLIYSAGYILRGKPHFFLAEIEEVHTHDDYRIIISGKEYARELSAPPALSQGQTIFIRSEALRQTVWEKVEESLWNKTQSPLLRAIHCYDFENQHKCSLTELCNSEIRTLVAHEVGEIKAGHLLGSSWQEMVSRTDHPPLELMLRAIRDNLADCLETIPDIIEDHNPARLHFFIANISNMRKALFPALREAYDQWLEDGSLQHLEKLAQKGRDHWLAAANTLLELFQKEGRIDPVRFQDIIEANTL